MHRSSSNTRVSDEYFKGSPSSSSPSPSQGSIVGGVSRISLDGGNGIGGGTNQLPIYNPSSHVAKKERSRLRSAENAIHLIPLVLVLCAIILWFFSHPVDVIRKGGHVVVRSTQGLKVATLGVDGTQNSFLPHVEPQHVDRLSKRAIINQYPPR